MSNLCPSIPGLLANSSRELLVAINSARGVLDNIIYPRQLHTAGIVVKAVRDIDDYTEYTALQ